MVGLAENCVAKIMFKSFPSIEQLRNVVQYVTETKDTPSRIEFTGTRLVAGIQFGHNRELVLWIC